MLDYSKVAPELVAHLEFLKRESEENPTPPGWDAARAHAERVFPIRWGDNDPIDKIFDHYIQSDGQELKLRVYQPERSVGTILFLHGGGWVNGSVTTHDGCCIMLANQSNMAVVSVNYRKAPENKFPAGMNDGVNALDWLFEQGGELGLNVGNVMISGESSGGNLAAVVARHARDKKLDLKGQILIYPATDAHMLTESYKQFEVGFMISKADLSNCFNDYLPVGADRKNPDISPLLADDLSGICPTFLATCDHDPLRDDGRAYAAKLIAAGVNTQYVEMQGALHGIWIMRAVTPLSAQLVSRAARWVVEQNSQL